MRAAAGRAWCLEEQHLRGSAGSMRRWTVAQSSKFQRQAFTRSISGCVRMGRSWTDRKSTRLNSSHSQISYAVFCLKKKKKKNEKTKSPKKIRTLEI